MRTTGCNGASAERGSMDMQTNCRKKARQKAHLGGVRDRRFLRRRVGNREFRIGKTKLHGQLDHVLVD